MKRCCFLMKVKKEELENYLEHHEPVWPEMLKAMSDAGIKNYSMFHRDDGLLVGYFEAEDPDEALEKAAATDASKRWQEYMAPFFESVSPELKSKVPMFLKEYFYME